MQYRRKRFSYFLIICLLISAVYTDKMSVVPAAGSSKTGISLRIDNRTVSGKTISIKKGEKKKIKVIIPKKNTYKITFRSNKGSIVSVSKSGQITAKRVGTVKVTVLAKSKKKTYKSRVKIKVVLSDTATVKPSDTTAAPSVLPTAAPSILPTSAPTEAPTSAPSASPTAVPYAPPTSAPFETPTSAPSASPTLTPSASPTSATTEIPTATLLPSDVPTTAPTYSPAPDTEGVSDMYEITIRVNGKAFPAKLYQTETAEEFMQKLPLSVTMNELNGNEKYYYFSENFKTEPQKASQIHAGDLKLYGSSCLVLFYESFSTSYSYTSLGYVENPEGLAEALGKGNVSVDITGP